MNTIRAPDRERQGTLQKIHEVDNMNAQEMREYAVRLMKSRKGLNSYTNEADRKYFFGKPDNAAGNTRQKGFSDCSSACRAAIKAAAGIDIGGNTDAQIRNRAKGVIVDESANGMPDESKLLPGDCLYFRGNKYHIMNVGHVEMYTGKNELYGHGGGTGPQKHNLQEYCRQRKNGDRAYFMAIRWIPDHAENGAEPPKPVLRKGSAGEYVAKMQGMLISQGYSCGRWGADGEFGIGTDSAVRTFQQDHRLAVDGVCGANTWAALETGMPGDTEQTDKPAAKTVRVSAGTWHVRVAPSASAAKLGYVKAGDVLEGSGETADGWVGVAFNGERAWVSAKGVEK